MTEYDPFTLFRRPLLCATLTSLLLVNGCSGDGGGFSEDDSPTPTTTPIGDDDASPIGDDDASPIGDDDASPIGDDDTPQSDGPLEIVGEYTDPDNRFHSISESSWIIYGDGGESHYAIAYWSNETGFLIAENGSQNGSNPGLWSRFDWAVWDGFFWYCLTVEDAASASDAEEQPRPDDTNVPGGGCHDAPWTQLIEAQSPPGDDDATPPPGDDDATPPPGDDDATPPPGDDDATPPPGDDDTTGDENALAIAGTYNDTNGYFHEITSTQWAMYSTQGDAFYRVSAYSNDDTYVIAQNDASNAENPGLWSRFDWVIWDDDVWICHTATDAESEDAALASDTADASNPPGGGCHDSAWNHLIATDGEPPSGGSGGDTGGGDTGGNTYGTDDDTAPLEIIGTWQDTELVFHEIDSEYWSIIINGELDSLYIIDHYSNSEEYVIAQSFDIVDESAGLWSRFDWISYNDDLWYCHTTADAASAEEAEAMEPDETNPPAEGCGDGPWTQWFVFTE